MKKILTCLSIFAIVLVGCSSKPSKQDVKNSLHKQVEKEIATRNNVTIEKKSAFAYIDCVVDKSYDKLSAKTLNQMVKITSSVEVTDVGTKKEQNTLQDASADCISKA